ncbi:MAG: hypothetical protein GF398_10955 [Chitinivibrionales bacterium]|nr:hypothetical protein [Chitinivibrionales bacterium]
MSKFNISYLDAHDEERVVAWERALYRAFNSAELLELIWDVDRKNRRIKTRIPYASQLIVVGSVEDAVIAGMAINFNMADRLQLEMYGFSLDKQESGMCEGLCLFNSLIFSGDSTVMFDMRDFMYEELRNRNITKTYGTCSENRIKGYRALGFRDIDRKVIDGHAKYLFVGRM